MEVIVYLLCHLHTSVAALPRPVKRPTNDERRDPAMRCLKLPSMSLALGLLVLSATVHAAPFAYITNAGDNTVSVIDTARKSTCSMVCLVG